MTVFIILFVFLWIISPMILIPIIIYLCIERNKLKGEADFANSRYYEFRDKANKLNEKIKQYEAIINEKEKDSKAEEETIKPKKVNDYVPVKTANKDKPVVVLLDRTDRTAEKITKTDDVVKEVMAINAPKEIKVEELVKETKSEELVNEVKTVNVADKVIIEDTVKENKTPARKSDDDLFIEEIKDETFYIKKKDIKKNKISVAAILFGLGVFFVLIAAVIFATTTWTILPLVAKILLLVGVSGLFFGVSFVSNRYFKLRETSIVFYMLGIVALGASNIAMAFMGAYGKDLLITMSGRLLVTALTLGIFSVGLLLAMLIYKTKVMIDIGYFFIIATVLFFTSSMFDSIEVNLLALGITVGLWLIYVKIYEADTEFMFIGFSSMAIAIIMTIISFFVIIGKGENTSVVMIGTMAVLTLVDGLIAALMLYRFDKGFLFRMCQVFTFVSALIWGIGSANIIYADNGSRITAVSIVLIAALIYVFAYEINNEDEFIRTCVFLITIFMTPIVFFIVFAGASKVMPLLLISTIVLLTANVLFMVSMRLNDNSKTLSFLSGTLVILSVITVIFGIANVSMNDNAFVILMIAIAMLVALIYAVIAELPKGKGDILYNAVIALVVLTILSFITVGFNLTGQETLLKVAAFMVVITDVVATAIMVVVKSHYLGPVVGVIISDLALISAMNRVVSEYSTNIAFKMLIIALVMALTVIYIGVVEYKKRSMVVGIILSIVSVLITSTSFFISMFYEGNYSYVLLVAELVMVAVNVVTAVLLFKSKENSISGYVNILSGIVATMSLGFNITEIDYFYESLLVGTALVVIAGILVNKVFKEKLSNHRAMCYFWYAVTEMVIVLELFVYIIEKNVRFVIADGVIIEQTFQSINAWWIVGVGVLFALAIAWYITHVKNKINIISIGSAMAVLLTSMDLAQLMNYYLPGLDLKLYYVLVAIIIFGLGMLSFGKMAQGIDDKKYSFDLLGVISIIPLIWNILISDYSIEYIQTINAVAIAAYFMGMAFRVNNKYVGKILQTFSLLACTVYGCGFAIRNCPSDWVFEIVLAVVIASLMLGKIIWNSVFKYYNYFLLVALSIIYIIEMLAIEIWWFDDSAAYLSIYKIAILMAAALIIFVVGLVTKNKAYKYVGYLMTAIVPILWNTCDLKWIFFINVAVSIGIMIYMIIDRMGLISFVSILQIYCVLFALKITNVQWLIVFTVSIAIAWGLYVIREKIEQTLWADNWLVEASIMAVIGMFIDGTPTLKFLSGLALAIYVLSHYRRYIEDKEHIVNKLILSGVLLAVSTTIAFQKLFVVPEIAGMEWYLAIIIITVLINQFAIYGEGTNTWLGWVSFAIVSICALTQYINTMITREMFDSLFLGISAVICLLFAYFNKRIQWFILSVLTLFGLAIYSTKNQWLNLVWLAFLVVVGGILIGIAIKNEYTRRHGIEENKDASEKWRV